MFPGTCSSPMRWLPWGEAGSGRGCRYPKHGITTQVWKRMLAMYTQSSGDTCPSDWIGRMGTNIEVFGAHCLCLEDVVQAGGILSELGEHCPSWESIVCVWRILSKLGEHCPSWRNIVRAATGRALCMLGEYCPSCENIEAVGK